MKNVTISLDEDLARLARIKAAEEDKSLSRFVADLLKERLGDKSDDRARFLRAFRSVKPVRLREPGEKLSTREELYDRKVLRR
jgi:hypothetical protein